MTLRNFRLCTLNTVLYDKSIGPYIILEFLRQLSGEASNLFGKYLEALNSFLEGPRHKQSFKNQLSSLAFSLGQIHNALKSFDSGLEVSVPVSRVRKRRGKTDFLSNSTSRLFTTYHQSHLLSSNSWVLFSILQTFEQAPRLRRQNYLVFKLSYFPQKEDWMGL